MKQIWWMIQAVRISLKSGCRYPEHVCNSTKSTTSLMFAAAADGTVLPSYIVYKALNLYDTLTEGGPKKCRYNRSKSGWFDSVCFKDWFFSVVLPYMRRLSSKKVLLGNNLSWQSSINVEKRIFCSFSYHRIPLI